MGMKVSATSRAREIISVRERRAMREAAFAALAAGGRSLAASSSARGLRTCSARSPARMGARRGRAEDEIVRVASLRGVDRSVAERAAASVARGVGVSEFLSPSAGDELLLACRRALPRATVVREGGFAGAERTLLACGRGDEEAVRARARASMKAVEIAGAFGRARGVSQRDLLGAVLAQIGRERVGDVLLGEEGGFAVVAAEVAEAVAGGMDSVGGVRVEARVVEVGEVRVPERKVKEITSVEKSTRLDAVGSAGFGMSRSKMAEGIKGGSVKVNHREVGSVAKSLKSGDVVSFRGKGRIEIGECGETRKGNIRISILRYL